MKKGFFLLLFSASLVGCGFLSGEETIRYLEVTREVEVIQEIEVTRIVEQETNVLGQWIIQDTITKDGQYLVPEEMEFGQWYYEAENPDDSCAAFTYSDLSGSSDSLLDVLMSVNKGYFILNEEIRMVELSSAFASSGSCTWMRIGE